MGILSSWIACDGCGLPASPEHIAERLSRLELATRFRPVHINVLFVALAPLPRPEDDFYGPPESSEYFNSLMDAVEITASAEKPSPGTDQPGSDSAKVVEFQRRGYYLAYLSECPIPAHSDSTNEAISTLGPTLLRRIRFNYKPKHVALLGASMAPMIEILKKAGMGPILLLDRGQPLVVPEPGDLTARAGFQAALPRGATRENLVPGYDRI